MLAGVDERADTGAGTDADASTDARTDEGAGDPGSPADNNNTSDQGPPSDSGGDSATHPATHLAFTRQPWNPAAIDRELPVQVSILDPRLDRRSQRATHWRRWL